MKSAIQLVEVDDAIAMQVRGTATPRQSFAPGFPRDDDLESMRGRERGADAFLVVHDDVVIGTCGTHGPASEDGELELGWGLVEQARGRGLGRAAVVALLDEMRERHPGVRLIAHTEWHVVDGVPAAVSPASEAILARTGFLPGPEPSATGDRRWSYPD